MDHIFCPVVEALIDNFAAYSDYIVHSTEIAYEVDTTLWKTYTGMANLLKVENQPEIIQLRIYIYLLTTLLG